MIRITFTFDEDTGAVDLKMTPRLKKPVYDDKAHMMLIALLSGISTGMSNILSVVPILRPATDAEREQKIYVFKNPDQDTRLFKTRQELYNSLGETFKALLVGLFPDVEYIETVRLAQQEASMDRTPEEHEAFLKVVEEITKEVRDA